MFPQLWLRSVGSVPPRSWFSRRLCHFSLGQWAATSCELAALPPSQLLVYLHLKSRQLGNGSLTRSNDTSGHPTLSQAVLFHGRSVHDPPFASWFVHRYRLITSSSFTHFFPYFFPSLPPNTIIVFLTAFSFCILVSRRYRGSESHASCQSHHGPQPRGPFLAGFTSPHTAHGQLVTICVMLQSLQLRRCAVHLDSKRPLLYHEIQQQSDWRLAVPMSQGRVSLRLHVQYPSRRTQP